MVDLDAVAHELYGLEPAHFTAARDDRAAGARRGGDRELAAAVKRLRRPSVSAWLANLLTRERAEELGRLLALGEGLRQAQEQLAGDQLRALSQQRHQVVAALVHEASRVAAERSQRPSPTALRELQETLEAALSDPAASDAVREGRLTSALSYSGLGTDGLPEADGTPTHRPERGQAAVREAEAGVATAERRRDQLQEELQRAEREHQRLAMRTEELTAQLEELRAQRGRAGEAVEHLRAQLDQTAAEVDAAHDRLSEVSRGS